jgi:N6-L-threonylcarbamoyladenine synthase
VITLGIETSCDETAVALVEDGFHVRANLIAAQVHLHERFGGVVPEVAARAHVEALNPLLAEALEAGSLDLAQIHGVAVTVGPGLVGALLVGMAAAKALSLALRVPLVGVHHLEGHYWANFLEDGPPRPPYVALIVSGGHTMLVHVPELHHHQVLGQTLDDAAGEAFDKVARLLGLGFPGGPAIDAMATDGDPAAIRFPRAMEDSGDLDFSLSRRPGASPSGSGGELPGGDRRRPGDEDDRGRRADGRADDPARRRRRREHPATGSAHRRG